MRFMLAALSATEADCASVTARCPDRITDATAGRWVGMNPAAMEFGPPGQNADNKPH